jgi:cell division protein FtsN
MNRDDLLKKCVDRGVADEGSVEAVSHLFYMYLLTALQKGQRVEVPNFGTFGTRVVGVKRLRRMPFFEVEKELAERVNERYRDLRYLMVGRYEMVQEEQAEQEYHGREAPHDQVVDQVGKEMVIDTHRDVTIEEYERTLSLKQATLEAKEKQTMPKLNLNEGGLGEEKLAEPEQPETPEAAVPPPPAESRGPSPILQVVIALALLATVTFALNYFGVIHLWGKRPAKVAETVLPPAEVSPPVVQGPTGTQQQPQGTPTPTPTPVPGKTVQPPAVTAEKPAATVPQKPVVTPPQKTAEKPVVRPEPAPPVTVAPKTNVPPSTAGGRYTVQVASWLTMSKANDDVARLTAAGLDAYISRGEVGGETRYRVRVGRYATMKDAEEAAGRLSGVIEDGIWVTRERAQ